MNRCQNIDPPYGKMSWYAHVLYYLALSKYKLKVVKLSIFEKCTEQGVLKFWCYDLFDRFQGYLESVVMKSAVTILFANVMTSKGYVTYGAKSHKQHYCVKCLSVIGNLL